MVEPQGRKGDEHRGAFEMFSTVLQVYPQEVCERQKQSIFRFGGQEVFTNLSDTGRAQIPSGKALEFLSATASLHPLCPRKAP